MKPKPTLRNFLLLAGSSLLAISYSHAGQIWDGGGADNNWTTAGNWDDDTLPNYGSAVSFAGNVQNSTNNDRTAGSGAVLNFTNDGSAGNTNAFILDGNSITVGNITTTANTAGSTITDEIRLDLIINNNRQIFTNQLSDTVQHNLSISGAISQAGGPEATGRGLYKRGNGGVLTLSGENSFTGQLRVGAGTVRAGAAANGQAFGLNAPVLLDNVVGVTLDLNGYNQTIGSLTGSGDRPAITLGSGILTVNQTTNTAHPGTITGTGGGLIKTGAGTLTLSNSTGNTYTGPTTVNGGTLALGADNTLPDVSNVILGAATLSAGNSVNDTVGTLDVTGAATISLGSGATLAFANSSGLNSGSWAGTLNITGFVSGSSLNFGSQTGLSVQQLGKISADGFSNFSLDAEGDLIADNTGGAPEIAVDQGGNIESGGSRNFGTVTLGSSSPLVFTINNTGSAALNLTGTPPNYVAVSGTNAADFTITAQPSTPVAASGNTAFTVQFAPLGTTSGTRNAVLTIANNDSNEGSFTINVSGSAQTPYEAWAGPGVLFGADANGDGIENGLAFLLGALSPTSAVTVPTVTQASGNLVLNFQCLKDAYRGSAALSVEHSNSLGGPSDPWLAALVSDAGTPANNVVFSVSSASTTLNNVTATINASEAGGTGKLFGRLKAVP